MQSSSKKNAKIKADKYFSMYIRVRDSKDGICKCITCGTLDSIKNMDAGHFISRRFEATRYDEKNVHAQCRKCNRFQNGNQYEHGIAIDKKYGEGTSHELYLKSKMICKRNKFDYEEISRKYRELL